MKFELPELPYARDALEPHISKQTFDYHYGKHHQTYVDKLNAAVADEPETTLEEVIARKDPKTFNAAAQTWNHTFFWHSMTPGGGKLEDDRLKKLINEAFGDLDTFKKTFVEKAVAQFGSGWAWLVQNEDGKLDIITTKDAETPLGSKQRPLLTLDVWEHAYYLDYKHDRKGFAETFLNHLANWSFAASNLR